MAASSQTSQRRAFAVRLRVCLRALPTLCLAFLLTGLPEAAFVCCGGSGSQLSVSAAAGRERDAAVADSDEEPEGAASCCRVRLQPEGGASVCQCTPATQRQGNCCCRARGRVVQTRTADTADGSTSPAGRTPTQPEIVACQCCGTGGHSLAATAAQPKLAVPRAAVPQAAQCEWMVELAAGQLTFFRAAPAVPPPRAVSPRCGC